MSYYSPDELAAASTSDVFLRYEDALECAQRLEALPRRKRRDQEHIITSLRTEAGELRRELVTRT